MLDAAPSPLTDLTSDCSGRCGDERGKRVPAVHGARGGRRRLRGATVAGAYAVCL